MKVALDATYSVGSNPSGVGRYSAELTRSLQTGFPNIEWRCYYRPHRWLRAPWPKRLLLDSTPRSCCLFHGLNQRLPKRTQIPAVATFHDLFVMTAEYSSPDFRQRFEAQARHAAAHAHHIIAVSQFTADQVADLLSYPRDRMTVVPHGVSNEPNVPPIESRQPIVLTVGAVQKRKNTARLIEAFTAMPAPWELWIAGSLGFEAEAVLESAKTNPRIRLLGYVADTELRELYRRAAIFAFPSLDEGFGMPVLEAMSYGVPVLTSNRSSLPEVAGDAAVLVDPFSVDSIAEGLRSLQEESSRHTWTERGLRRAREFTWERAARETAAVYESVLGVQFGTASYPEA